MTPVLHIENLGKRYAIRHDGNRTAYSTLREEVAGGISRFLGRTGLPGGGNRERNAVEQFWAVKSIDLELMAGERLGVIGRNGAGKSTLLKLLSRITEPTTGSIRIRGRIASLLEVGTGFHAELTGRENIFLNGAVLGMSRAEINRKFDEIVDFADIERFLDTPVKRYSSGMYVRLAFAVAAHLEPEILVVDEVLAVGDHAFQKKCLGRMEHFSAEGRTVILVSHNMAMIEKLCSRCILIEQGIKTLDDTPARAIAAYFGTHGPGASGRLELTNHPGRRDPATTLFRAIVLQDSSGRPVNRVPIAGYLQVMVELEAGRELDDMSFGLGIENESGERLFSVNSLMANGSYTRIESGRSATVIFTLPVINLMPGEYAISLAAVRSQRDYLDLIERCVQFEVVPGDVYGTGRLPTRQQGQLYMPASVETTGDELGGKP